jgi:hypothetical protein
MQKPPKLPPVAIAGGVAVTIYLLNYGAVQIGFRPFAYCWGRHLVPLFEGYWQLVGLAVLCYFLWAVWQRGIMGGILAGGLVVLVFGAGTFLTTIFGLGVVERCG